MEVWVMEDQSKAINPNVCGEETALWGDNDADSLITINGDSIGTLTGLNNYSVSPMMLSINGSNTITFEEPKPSVEETNYKAIMSMIEDYPELKNEWDNFMMHLKLRWNPNDYGGSF